MIEQLDLAPVARVAHKQHGNFIGHRYQKTMNDEATTGSGKIDCWRTGSETALEYRHLPVLQICVNYRTNNEL
jgi:hypothetical protein